MKFLIAPRLALLSIVLGLPTGLLATTDNVPEPAAETARVAEAPVQIAVTLRPLAYLATALLGDAAEVTVLSNQRDACHALEFRPSKLEALGEARLLLAAGLPSEAPLLERLEQTHQGLPVLVLKPASTPGADPELDRDPHWWLDPHAMRTASAHLAQQLSGIVDDPEALQVRLATLQAELEQAELAAAEALASWQDHAFVTLHAAYGHFAHRFGVRQVAPALDIHHLTPRRLAAILEQAREGDARFVVAMQQGHIAEAEAVAQKLGIPLIQVDPLSDAYTDNLKSLAETFAATWALGDHAATRL